jgi:hypothetical protein
MQSESERKKERQTDRGRERDEEKETCLSFFTFYNHNAIFHSFFNIFLLLATNRNLCQSDQQAFRDACSGLFVDWYYFRIGDNIMNIGKHSQISCILCK